ncbi:hypothetical protein GCM10022393_15030 [Aquimarina addita]|uniref:Lipoprotein n=1 Tax=Aquimarina addita TaxID=870485 RepID=A0ABP7XFS9_9FLAO
MRLIILVLLSLLLVRCNQEKEINGKLILEKTIRQHDSLDLWSTTHLNIHIQEPRISNPQRYSILKLNNATNAFSLSRNKEQHIAEYIIDNNGANLVLLDGKIETDTLLIKKYRLDASRNTGYREFYQLLYGLPMSLDNALKEITHTSESIFKGEECYKLEIELAKPVISKYWNLFISKSNMEVKGIEIISPDKPDQGERIYFEESILINGIKLPRMRHWYELKDNKYTGSDLIIKEVLDELSK